MKLDLLVNNAGVMRIPRREVTVDGFERQLGTNFLGPFALTMLLMPALRRSPAPRVTTVSSGAASMGLKRIQFEDLQWERKYAPWNAYCQTKLADLMLMRELGRRSDAAGIDLISNAAHPGFARTNLQTSGPGREMNAIEKFASIFISHDAAHGALPTLRAATVTDTATDRYYGPDAFFHLKGDPIEVDLPKQALDDDATRKLWKTAEELTGAEVAFLNGLHRRGSHGKRTPAAETMPSQNVPSQNQVLRSEETSKRNSCKLRLCCRCA